MGINLRRSPRGALCLPPLRQSKVRKPGAFIPGHTKRKPSRYARQGARSRVHEATPAVNTWFAVKGDRRGRTAGEPQESRRLNSVAPADLSLFLLSSIEPSPTLLGGGSF